MFSLNPNPVKKLLTVFTLALLAACQNSDFTPTGELVLDLPTTRYQYNNFGDTTNAISTLGRVLFYERQMSINNSVSCASCHKQSAGFADNVKFSKGFALGLTTRNSMPIQNLNAFSFEFAAFDGMKNVDMKPASQFGFFGGNHFFWDGREQNLEKLILQPVGNHIEMGITDAQALATKLSKLPYYESLFTDAFQSPEITPEKIEKAVATFISSITTTHTRFDDHLQKVSLTNDFSQSPLSALELEGSSLFVTKYQCNNCHQVSMPNGYLLAGTFANIGLDETSTDIGLQAKTGNPQDAGKFKIPSLRNVAYTAPYMHDGRFATLEDVIDHYSEGIANNPNLDNRLREANGQPREMNISAHEKQAIIAFLRSLSDESVITDPRFSDPFKLK